ncbi:MAG: hypothetical protein JWQ10_934 [Herbaspirillum sp.]|nr:hypothetical protein [Herbaspirillum sp.]
MTDAINTSYATNVNARPSPQAGNNPKTAMHKSRKIVVDRSEKKSKNLFSRLTSAFRKNPLEKKDRPYLQAMNDKYETTSLSKSELDMVDQRVLKWAESIRDIKWPTTPLPIERTLLSDFLLKNMALANDSLPKKPVRTIKQRLHEAINKILPRRKDEITSISEADENERAAASPKNKSSKQNIFGKLNILSQKRKTSFSSSIIEEILPDRPHLKPFWPES